jgi:ATP-binding cassette subfamily B protein
MNNIRKLLPFVKPYWKQSLLSLILLTMMVVLDLAIPRLVQRIIDQGINQGNQQVVVQTSLIMLGISLASVIIAVANNIFSVQAGEGVARDLREALFFKVQTLSFANLDRFPTGRLMVRMSSDTGAFQRLVQVSLRIGTRAPMMMVGSLILMFNTNRALALTMLPLLLFTLVVIIVFSLKMEPIYRTVQQKLDRLNTVLQENLAGARLVKAFVRAAHEGERFEGANEDFTRRTITVMQIMSSVWPALSMLVNLGMVLVIWVGGLSAIEGSLTLGEIRLHQLYADDNGPFDHDDHAFERLGKWHRFRRPHQRSAGYGQRSAGSP